MKDKELRDKMASEVRPLGKRLSPYEQDLWCDGWDAARANPLAPEASEEVLKNHEVTFLKLRVAELKQERDRLQVELSRQEKLALNEFSRWESFENERDQLRDEIKNSNKFDQDQENKIAGLKAAAEKLAEALYDDTYNCIRETLALMSEGEGDNPQTYRQMAKHALTRLDKALAEYREKFPKEDK